MHIQHIKHITLCTKHIEGFSNRPSHSFDHDSLPVSYTHLEKPETMSHKDAAMFPLIASAALFGLYLFFKVSRRHNMEHTHFSATVYFQ